MSMGDAEDLPHGALPPGHVLAGRYRVERVLGEGASGIVYVADDQDGEGQVALKVIHRHLIRDRQINRRFNREARILRSLSGDHLVPLLDFGETDDGVLYMALALVDGEPLERLMHDGPLPPARAADIVIQICAALEMAHAAGIVHRDLKPGNVLVEHNGGREHVRVLDFGMAKLIRGNPSASLNVLTEQNMVFGTPEYMAPEQARGDEVDARADIYAAGVILYELVTGSVPFSANSPIGVMTAHLLEQPTPPSNRAAGRDVPPALEAAIMHALAKDPDDRYSSADELANAVAGAVERPTDVASTMPPPRDGADRDLATRDTEHALRLPEMLRETSPGPVPSPAAERGPGRTWIVIGLIAVVIGIIVGILMSLAGGV